MASPAGSGTKQLNQCPTNVKEALEWLAALADGASECANVITQKILGNTTGHTLGSGNLNGVCQTLCQKAATFMNEIKQQSNGAHASYTSYQPTSTYQGAQWSNLCQNKGGYCCQINGRGGCRECNTSHGAQCTGCCKNCPKQICARIFCLIVPVVYSALQYVQYVLLQNGYSSGNGNDIHAYLRALGFNNGAQQYGAQISADQVRRVLQQLRAPQSGDLLGALGAATQAINTALQQSTNIFVDGQSSGGLSISHSSTTPALTTPTSAKDLMLWTVFLPYCCNYNVHGMLRVAGLAPNGGGSSGPRGSGSPHLSPLDSLMYGLHVLFIGMEGAAQQLSSSLPSDTQSSPSPRTPQPPQPPRTLFDGINMVCQGWAPYEYYTSGTNSYSSYTAGPDPCLKLLIAGIPIISSAVEMLQGHSGGGTHGGMYAHGNGLEQNLGFSGNVMGGHGLHPSLGQHFYNYVYSMVNGIKTAYASDKFDVNLASYSTGTASSATTPTTFREMLLWLQGLPCSGRYSDIRTLLSTGPSGSTSGPTTVQTLDPLVGIIFNLPHLFYYLEPDNSSGAGTPVSHSNGAMTAYISDLFQRQGIQVKGDKGSPKRSTPSPMPTFSYDTTTIQKTFCAIVTVVYYVVDHLKRKYNGSRGYDGITDGSLGAFLEFLGWDQNTITGALASGYGLNLHSVLQYCFGNGNGAAYSRGANGASGNYLSRLFQQLSKSIQTASTSISSTAPPTFRETLLCLVGAPLTQDYENTVKTEWNNTASSRPSSSHSSTNIESDITDTIVGVLQLFNRLEGNILSAVLGVFTAEQNGTIRLTYDYGSSSSNDHLGHSIFGASVVMRSVFGFLQQRCNRMGALVGESQGESSWQSCNVTCGNGGKQTAGGQQCQNNNNPLCKFLCLLGWDHQTRGGVGTATKSKDSASFTGSKFHTLLLKWFGSLDPTDQGALSSSYYGQPSAPSLKALYDCAVQWFRKKTEGADTTPSSITPTTTPTTIRDMMLWLIGLPLHDKYKALTGSNGTSGVIQTKFDSLKSRSSGVGTATSNMYSLGSQLSNSSKITNAIVSSSQGMIITMLAIEGSIKSVWDFLAKGLKKDNQSFNYGSSSGTSSSGSGSKSGSSGNDADVCFNLLVDYTYKVHYQLRFLMVMCNETKNDGGWKDCEYGNGTASGMGAGSSGSGSLTCQCNGNTGQCPRPLYNFLLGQGVNQFKNNLNGNGASDAEKNSDGNLRMGFFNGTLTSTTLSTTSNGKLTGSDIHALLKYFIDTATEFKNTASNVSTPPLSLLAQYIVAIGERGPQSLGDCFELVWQLGSGTLYSYVNEKLKQELKDITLEVTGEQKNAENELITAIQNIIPGTAKHTDHKDKRDLSSLMCNPNGGSTSSGTTNSCAPYMKSLSQGVYHYYLPQITGAGSTETFGVFQYLYDMLRKLLDGMKQLQKEFDECPCCTTKQCDSLISCQYAHPILYKFGFVFGEPSKLKSGTKKCDTLKEQLTAVLSCTQGSESTLFKAFECVIQVTYSILLKRAKGIIDKKYDKNGNGGKTTAEGLQSTKKEMNTAFTLYVENAMYQSYPKLICTFACKVFSDKHTCEGDTCKERFNKEIAKPEKEIATPSSTTLQVSSTTVTTITAVIPQYTAPVIDPYHYRVFKKATTVSKDTSTSYDFQSAMDFHIKGANCIRPTPVALRSVIDWILRVTTGAIATQDGKDNGKNSNDNIKALCDAIKKVFKESGVSVDEVEKHIVSLVQGLRTFMGYQDRSKDVKEGVKKALGDAKETNNNGVKKLLDAEIKKITDFIGQEGSKSFGSELGKALLKGRYECKHSLFSEVMRTISAVVSVVTGYKKDAEPKTFKEVVELFTKILSSTHEGCKDLKCTTLQSNGSQSNDQNDGLKLLKEFFEQLKSFAQKWNSIGQDNGHGILQKQKGLAATAVAQKCNGTSASPSSNDQYFTKLYEALKQLGQCAQKVQKLNENNNGSENSQQYREKITALIDGLKKFNTALNGSDSANIADPVYAVKGAEKLIEETKKGVGRYITTSINTELVNGYSTMSSRLKIESQITSVINTVKSFMEMHRYHLYDLKQLCQWLYRMGQLYAHGLKGFVESLVKHLEYIIEVIGCIAHLDGFCSHLNGITMHHSDSGGKTYLLGINDRVSKLLGSYVLHELPEGNSDKTNDTQKVQQRRQFLRDLRLLALDRYTLQVWHDECNQKNDCNIRDWITFENGIIRHSNLGDIKQKLCDLTGIAYNTNASPSASPSASHRIHDFHAICVIQKFSYQEPIAELERSLEKLKEIKEKLEGVKGKCHGSTTDVSSDTVVTSFCTLVDKFLKEPYGIFSFAKFLHTILGPNIFSAVIVALEHVKSANELNNNGNKNKFRGIITTMCEGLDGENNKDHYTLTHICQKLTEFITTLRKEYIFCYPVVTATATLPAAPAPSPPPQNPKCDNDDHSKSAICHHCYYYLAKIFIGAIPNLYRHCRLLYEMCKYEGIGKDGLWYNDVLQYYNSGLHYHDPCYQALGVYMSWRGWKVYKKKDPEAVPEKYDLSKTHKGINMFQSLKDIVSSSDALSTTTDLKPLDELFKAVMQHFKDVRNKERQQREQKLKKKFEQDPNNKGIPFQAPLPALPSTVREVLFWLHELDTNKAFYDQMSQHIKNLCQAASPSVTEHISQETILHVLKLSITQCLEVLATIEDPGRQNAQYYYELYTEEHYYAYPTVNIPLFFYTFVEKLMGAFLELNFVCVQCEFRATEGGWSECHIGKSEHSMNGQNCRCTKPHTTVSSVMPHSVEGSVVCPRPLYSFLFSDPKNQLRIPSDVSQRLPYMSKGTMPCGFKLKNKAITDAATKSNAYTPTPTPTSMTGSVLVEPLRKLVGGHVTGRHNDTTTNGLNTLSTVIYLRDLLRYTLCLAVRPPWSMSENMAFFYRVTEAWKKNNKGVRVAHPNPTLLKSIHKEIDLFPGTFDGERLTTAVERFAGLEGKEKHETSVPAPSGHHQYDLRTLMGCQGTNTPGTSGVNGPTAQCSPFIFPLSLDVYTHYDHKNSRAYLSWILNFAFGIYGQLKALEEMMKEQKCMRNASTSTPQCPLLPMCPGVLSALYQSGSSFMDQGQLAKKDTNTSGTNTTKKTCDDFHSVLTGLFNCDSNSCSPLHNLIVQCEAFLWSIRLPFSLVQLALWSFAVLFISYVFVVPLDHFKIKSHLFNRLKYTMHPSLLIADQQRRVSEVAYFSL